MIRLASYALYIHIFVYHTHIDICIYTEIYIDIYKRMKIAIHVQYIIYAYKLEPDAISGVKGIIFSLLGKLCTVHR